MFYTDFLFTASRNPFQQSIGNKNNYFTPYHDFLSVYDTCHFIKSKRTFVVLNSNSVPEASRGVTLIRKAPKEQVSEKEVPNEIDEDASETNNIDG